MVDITVFLWLPIADNMLPEIGGALEQRGAKSLVNIPQEGLQYEVTLRYGDADLRVSGSYSNQGWTKHALAIPDDPVRTEEQWFLQRVSTLVIKLQESILDLLFDTAPLAVKNKLAVLQEGIVSLDTFENTEFQTRLDSPAKDFLRRSQLTVVRVNEPEVRAFLGFRDASLEVEFPLSLAGEEAVSLVVGSAHRCAFVLWGNGKQWQFADTSDQLSDYCCLHITTAYSSRVIQVLKATREHVVPLRRQLAIALQKNTEDYSDLLTRIKRYLTYVHVKLPVIEKVGQHLESVVASGTIGDMTGKFQRVQEYASFPLFTAMDRERIKIKTLFDTPPNLYSALQSNLQRVAALYKENLDELRVLSSELTNVLEVTRLSENVQLLSRQVGTSVDLKDLERVGKNRADALKLLTIALTTNLAATALGDFKISGGLKWIIAFCATALVGFAIELYMRLNAKHYRVVLPINANAISTNALDQWVESHKPIRLERSGARTTASWDERLACSPLYFATSDESKQFRRYIKKWQYAKKFRMTVEYEPRGLIHALVLETEFGVSSIDTRALVGSVCLLLREAAIIGDGDLREQSLYVSLLNHLHIPISDELIGLNWLLSAPESVVRKALSETDGSSMSAGLPLAGVDKQSAGNILARGAAYVEWLRAMAAESSSEIGSLFKKDHLFAKAQALAAVAEKGEYEKAKGTSGGA